MTKTAKQIIEHLQSQMPEKRDIHEEEDETIQAVKEGWNSAIDEVNAIFDNMKD